MEKFPVGKCLLVMFRLHMEVIHVHVSLWCSVACHRRDIMNCGQGIGARQFQTINGYVWQEMAAVTTTYPRGCVQRETRDTESVRACDCYIHEINAALIWNHSQANQPLYTVNKTIPNVKTNLHASGKSSQGSNCIQRASKWWSRKCINCTNVLSCGGYESCVGLPPDLMHNHAVK